MIYEYIYSMRIFQRTFCVTKLINQSKIANFICLNLSYPFLVYPANSKNSIMTDEKLRAFCLKQAIQIITHSKQSRTMGLQNTDSMCLFELTEILLKYVKTGKQNYVPVYLNYFK